jgi:hypothetical protein
MLRFNNDALSCVMHDKNNNRHVVDDLHDEKQHCHQMTSVKKESDNIMRNTPQMRTLASKHTMRPSGVSTNGLISTCARARVCVCVCVCVRLIPHIIITSHAPALRRV